MKINILFYSLICFLPICNNIYGQSLPPKQEVSVRLPSGFKIDGTSAKWNGKFQAYNHATNLFYTIANDDKNLYLIVQSSDPNDILRIFGRGITWSFQPKDIKDVKGQIQITYPLVQNTPYFHLRKRKSEDQTLDIKFADSLKMHNNKIIDDSCKRIGISGLPGLDSLISVYNRDGIRASGKFDNKNIYTCEFSIRLKLLNVTLNDSKPIKYSICVNGIKPLPPIKPLYVVPGHEAQAEAFNAHANEFNAQQATATYFWGEYTLAKQ